MTRVRERLLVSENHQPPEYAPTVRIRADLDSDIVAIGTHTWAGIGTTVTTSRRRLLEALGATEAQDVLWWLLAEARWYADTGPRWGGDGPRPWEVEP